MANDLIFSSAHTLAQAVRAGQISAQDVVAAYLAQIKAVNPHEDIAFTLARILEQERGP
ncbi:MAG: hypothetical protein R3E79_08495 [Caldilineaceae bacterium]